MKKMLMIASVSSMIDQFTMNNIIVLKNMGYTVEIAANFEKGNTSSTERVKKFKEKLKKLNIHYYQIDFSRNILNLKANIRAYRQVDNLIKNNGYDFVHSHSPIGGAISRLITAKHKVKSIYTAHGFHFYKNAPKLNWIIYYPIERFLSRYTDITITLNDEDFLRAKKMESLEVVLCPGVGVDTMKFKYNLEARQLTRASLNISDDTTVYLSIGELIKRKNHETALKAFSKLRENNSVYLICGKGPLESKLKNLCRELGIDKNVYFLGFRTDVPELCSAADVFVFPSHQEGLPVAMMEAMAAGLPVVCSNVRGHTDLITDDKGGYLVSDNSIDQFTKCMIMLMNDEIKRKQFGAYNLQKVRDYDDENVKSILSSLYSFNN